MCSLIFRMDTNFVPLPTTPGRRFKSGHQLQKAAYFQKKYAAFCILACGAIPPSKGPGAIWNHYRSNRTHWPRSVDRRARVSEDKKTPEIFPGVFSFLLSPACRTAYRPPAPAIHWRSPGRGTLPPHG